MMSLLLSRLSKLSPGKSSLVRRSSSPLLLLSNGFSSSPLQTPPCAVSSASPCGDGLGKLGITYADGKSSNSFEKKVPMELIDSDPMITIGASHGWIATLKEDGILRLQDDFNPVASDTHPKRIPLPPLVTLPHCQTQIVTNVSMSSSSPEDQDCVVAVKFLGPQLSFCRPAAQGNPEWINVRISSPCFFSSRVMFSKKDEIFRMPGSGGQLIGSLDIHTQKKKRHKLKIQKLRFQNLPELSKTKQELLHSCYTSEHLVESGATGETFLVRLYRKAFATSRIVKMKTKDVMVFKLDEEGNAVYTRDIGYQNICLSRSEPFCAPPSCFVGEYSNHVDLLDVDEYASVHLLDSSIDSCSFLSQTPYHIPPQNMSLESLNLVWN
ncbi:unnamed protein product [Microthlaspi erraticum]|uniref:KIB1-4 beta-propeller domain-containing protein n=1 Tax=Microthlaspi erraticum TaxID=1685480 RepID=A0A6D2I4M7_9BRAS|nr:unnamed protein product [Microthlaspi erraticum]